ncbi:uncharacterized protein [Penaeus vannamei]|uniref:uncharacterized protein isoform X1 n=1 Tax=Penaeus vannamei TaxID=6689 RepID=UPI00387F512B
MFSSGLRDVPCQRASEAKRAGNVAEPALAMVGGAVGVGGSDVPTSIGGRSAPCLPTFRLPGSLLLRRHSGDEELPLPRPALPLPLRRPQALCPTLLGQPPERG